MSALNKGQAISPGPVLVIEVRVVDSNLIDLRMTADDAKLADCELAAATAVLLAQTVRRIYRMDVRDIIHEASIAKQEAAK